MKWAGMYFLGFAILVGGVLAALWKLGVLQNVSGIWIAIGVAILMGVGIMISVANSGTRENIQIDRKKEVAPGSGTGVRRATWCCPTQVVDEFYGRDGPPMRPHGCFHLIEKSAHQDTVPKRVRSGKLGCPGPNAPNAKSRSRS